MSQSIVHGTPDKEGFNPGEKIVTVTQPRIVQAMGGGNCLYENIPGICKDIHGVEKEDSVRITVTSRGWFVEVIEGSHGPE